MPRFENLKGSMNPFSNNRPRLTASERIKSSKCRKQTSFLQINVQKGKK